MDDIGLDLIKVLPPSSRRQAALTRAALDPFESYIKYHSKKKNPSNWMGFYLVDDIGLEPMTFRTSSGCSSQLS